jgi:hypothetical protein
MILRRTIYQNDAKGILDKGITFEVDYDMENNVVNSIDKVIVSDVKSGTKINITTLMYAYFQEQLESMLLTIDWKVVYANAIINNAIHKHD